MVGLMILVSGCQTTGRGLVLTERFQINPKTSASIKMVNGRSTFRTQDNGLVYSTYYLNPQTLIDLFRP